MSVLYVDINPDILRWAREEAGFDISEVVDKVHITQDRYIEWETKGNKVPFGKLCDLAKQFKRQPAVFFLPAVPAKLNKPKDFRNLAPNAKKLSKKVLLAMRDVTHFQHLATEINGESYWHNKYSWLTELESYSNSKAIISWLRAHLGISLEDQLEWKSDSHAYKSWREAIEEKLGILIFQFSMPLDEVQGFCLTQSYPHAIVVNSNHPYTGRIFTIFHELGHIIRHQSGLCLVDKVEKQQSEEWACNLLAGQFLAPKELITPVFDLDSIKKHANALKISREAYLRRLREERFITDAQFYPLLKNIKATYKPPVKKSAPIAPEVKSKASRGVTFYNMVLDAVNTNKIGYTEASNALGLSISRLLNEV